MQPIFQLIVGFKANANLEITNGINFDKVVSHWVNVAMKHGINYDGNNPLQWQILPLIWTHVRNPISSCKFIGESKSEGAGFAPTTFQAFELIVAFTSINDFQLIVGVFLNSESEGAQTIPIKPPQLIVKLISIMISEGGRAPQLIVKSLILNSDGARKMIVVSCNSKIFLILQNDCTIFCEGEWEHSAFGQNMASDPAFGQNFASGAASGHNMASGQAFGQNLASGPAFGHKFASGVASGLNLASGLAFGHKFASGAASGQNFASGVTSGQNFASGTASGQNFASSVASGQNFASGMAFGHNMAFGPAFGRNMAFGSAFGHNMAFGSAFSRDAAFGPAFGHNKLLITAFGHI
jgi:hypothetical protein